MNLAGTLVWGEKRKNVIKTQVFQIHTYILIFTSDIYIVAKTKQKNLLHKSLPKEEDTNRNSQKAKNQSKDKKKAKKRFFLWRRRRNPSIGQGGSGMPKSGGYYYGYSTQYCSKQRLQKPFF